MPTASLPEWRAYSKEDAAAVVGVPVPTIEAAIRRGDLEARRLGKHWRISDSALRRWVGQDPAVVA